ncbi:MAG: hypothetical protein RQ750_17770 [Roseovarius sp.]|nr:hypothetical protein [Roseovarius sp.]
MLRLGLKKEDEWLDLVHGVRVKVRPYSTIIALRAREDAHLRSVAMAGAPDPELSFASGVAVAKVAIIEWEGVVDDAGKPIDPTPELIGQLMDLAEIYAVFFIRYLMPSFLLDSEKNVSAPSPNGTTAAARTTACRARRPAKSARKSSTRH